MNILFLYHDIPFELYTVYIIICITLINMKHSHFFYYYLVINYVLNK